MWRIHAPYRETNGCPAPTPLSARLDHSCRMNSETTSRNTYVRRRATHSCAFLLNQSALGDRPTSPQLPSRRFALNVGLRRFLFHPKLNSCYYLGSLYSLHSISIDPRPPRDRLRSDGFIERAPNTCLALGFLHCARPIKHLRHSGAVLGRADEPSFSLRVSLTFLTRAGRRSAHFRMASRAGHRDCPHDVRLYSTLGGTCG